MPRARGALLTDDSPVRMDVQVDAQGRRYIVVVCGGRSGNMYLDKFYKLPGNKGYEKCIYYNSTFVAPHEFESICGMKAMKAWKKSIKHNSHPLLTYMSSGVLSDNESDRISLMIDAKMDTAFKQMEFRLVSSLQEVICSSIDSLRSAIELQVSSLNAKVSDLTERVNKLESERMEATPSVNLGNSQSQPNPPTLSEITSTVVSLLNEEKDKEKRKMNVIIHGIPESKSEEPLERKAYDIDQVNTIFQKHLNVEVAVDNAVRLGKKVNEKSRLLKITLPTESAKKQVMRSSGQLRNDSNPDWMKKLYITQDLTPKEQEENRELRKKLSELNSTGRIYRIKNGQIVRRVN